jgi:hypothetical protein
MAAAVPISTRAGVTRKYSDANLISRAPIFLPRYSGVRPTISPATNTVITARISMPYRPEPVPPGATSPSIMLMIGIMPPSAVYESWKESTAPVEVSVVAAANAAELGTPNRVSLPSVAAPTARGTVPSWAVSKPIVSATLARAMTAMAARIAYPCRFWPTMRPKTRGRLNGMHSSRKISSQLVHDVGFSNGWALLML